MEIAMIVLAVVLVLITCQQLLPIHIPIWVIMLGGAVAMLCFRQISWFDAWQSIDWNIIGFLFGVFVLAEYLEQVHVTHRFADTLLRQPYSIPILLLMLIAAAAVASLFLMNDAVAIMGVPVCLRVAKSVGVSAKPWLLALALAVTIGSVASPIGNPQNLLVAVDGGIKQPFISFFSMFSFASLINLMLLYGVIVWRYRRQLRPGQLQAASAVTAVVVEDKEMTLAMFSLVLLVVLVVLKIVLIMLGTLYNVPFYAIALVSIVPLLLCSPRRVAVCRNMDWGTLVFFVAMFIVMRSVWDGGFIQQQLARVALPLDHVSGIMIISALLSQLVSNVPAVALYLPILKHLGAQQQQLLALACGATISGMFTIMGAASTIIILQNTQQRGEKCFSALEFMLIGLPLGCVNMLVYYVFLSGQWAWLG